MIFHEGDRGDSVHLIERGHVAVRVGTVLGEVAILTMLGPGSAFGELALIDGNERRSATVIAVGATDTRVVDHAEFERAAPRAPTDTGVSRRAARGPGAAALGADDRGDVRARRHPGVAPAPRGHAGVRREQRDHDRPDPRRPRLHGRHTRPTANRVLKRAEADGLLRLGRGRVEILDPAGLASPREIAIAASVSECDQKLRLSPPKRPLTEPSQKMASMAPARSGAIDMTRSESNCLSSEIGSVLLTITSRTGAFFSRSTAGPESNPWVAAMTTSVAPRSTSRLAALTTVPAVSIMSSTSTHVRPAISPTTSVATATLCTPFGRRLSMNASSTSSRGLELRRVPGELAAAGVGRHEP